MTEPSERNTQEGTKEQTQNSARNGPDIELRDGPLRSASWRNEGEHGAFYNTRMNRSYIDKEGQFKETTTMRERDLLPLAKLAEDTYRQIVNHKRDHAHDKGLPKSASQESDMQENADELHDENQSCGDIKREKFKTQRSSKGTSRSKFREPEAR